jgi:hypothetical protein
MPLRVRAAFLPPEGAEGVRPLACTVVLEAELAGMTATLRARRPGTKRFRPLLEDWAGGQTRVAVRPLAELTGPDGALPEFELRIAPPRGSAPGLGEGRWDLRVFDLELTGVAPGETER